MIGNILVCNKLKRTDSITGQDVWYSHELNGIKYKRDKVQTVVGTDVSIGNSFVILIPFDNEYLPYSEWKESVREKHYTLSAGDVIFFEKPSETIIASNIAVLKKSYLSCEVRSIEEVPQKNGARIRLRVSGV